MDVIGELIVRPRLEDADIESERAVIIEEIRSYLDDPSEYCQILFQTAMFGDGPLGREICGEEADILALPEAAIRDFWRSGLPAGQHGRRRRRRPRPRRGARPRRDRVRDRQRRDPGLRPGAGAAGRTARPDRQARHEPGAGLPRRPGPPSRPPRQLDAGRPQRGPRRRDEQPAVPVGPRGARARLRRLVGARRLRRRRRARGLGRGRSGRAAGGPRGDPGRARAAARRARPGRRAREGQALPLGRPRAADGRHPPRRVVDRRPGGAPRPGPDARGGARGGRGGRRARPSSASPPRSSATTRCGSRPSRRPATCAASSAHLRLPA